MSNKIAIICNGKEIAFGVNLLHLFQYKSEKEAFSSDNNAGLGAEIFSISAFKHAGISKKAIKVFIGETQSVSPTLKKLFCQYGMTIWGYDTEYILKADAKILTGDTYEKFIGFANKKRTEYMELEKEYVRKTAERDSNWIVGEFKQVTDAGLFGQMNAVKKKIKQQYDCMALLMYLDYLRKEKV